MWTGDSYLFSVDSECIVETHLCVRMGESGDLKTLMPFNRVVMDNRGENA